MAVYMASGDGGECGTARSASPSVRGSAPTSANDSKLSDSCLFYMCSAERTREPYKHLHVIRQDLACPLAARRRGYSINSILVSGVCTLQSALSTQRLSTQTQSHERNMQTLTPTRTAEPYAKREPLLNTSNDILESAT